MLQFDIFAIGMAEALAEVAAIGKVATPSGKKALQDLGPQMVAEAQILVPKDTWALHDSIDFRKTERGISLFAGMYYAYFVEYGTRYMRAQPYLRPVLAKYLDTGDAGRYIAEKIHKDAQGESGKIAAAAMGAGILGGLTAVIMMITALIMGYAMMSGMQ